MVIRIKNIARDLKIRLPDLITRSVGRRIYERARKNMSHLTDGEVVLVDFAGIQVIDSSFVDEFLLRMIEDSRGPGITFFIKLANITPIMETNIDSVFSSYRAYNDSRIAVVTESLTGSNAYYIGGLTEAERDVLDYLRINKAAHVADIASLIAKEEPEAMELLESLYALRLARRGPAGESGRFQSV